MVQWLHFGKGTSLPSTKFLPLRRIIKLGTITYCDASNYWQQTVMFLLLPGNQVLKSAPWWPILVEKRPEPVSWLL